MNVTVVGAGVIGLSTAVELERAGHVVTVVAAATGDATVSAVAGALWFPYRAGPIDRVVDWAARTRDRLIALAASTPAAGVDLVTVLQLDPAEPWWLPAIPDAEPIVADLPGRPPAWRFRAPRIEPARFLPWLEAQLARPIVRAAVASVDDVAGDVVVVCAGLGARALARDDTVIGVAGQIAVALPGALDLSRSICDDRDPAAMFYAIPRRGEVVLGGTAIEIAGDVAPPPDPALTARFVADAARLGLAPGPVVTVRTGVRPCRPEVRLERRGRIVYNYGHGGAGYTLSFGCAEEVAARVATTG
jgi:D-amino-acid oxidase